MILLELYLSFLKIGFTSFGGLSMIPLIKDEMLGHGWMTVSEVTDIVAIAEMTPGPLGLNCATFVGVRMSGILGAIVANLGVLSPSFSVALVSALFFEKFRKSRVMERMLIGIRPAVVGMIAGVTITLAQTTFIAANGSIDLMALAIGAIALYLLMKRKWSIPAVIGVSALLGLVCYWAIPKLQ